MYFIITRYKVIYSLFIPELLPLFIYIFILFLMPPETFMEKREYLLVITSFSYFLKLISRGFRKITTKYENQLKYFSILHEVTVQN